jgi:hypothetical protein
VLPLAVSAALGMLTVFTLVVAGALIAGKSQIKCGCMILGSKEVIGWYICLRNAGLACLLLPTLRPSSASMSLTAAVVLLVGSVISMNPGDVRLHAVRSNRRPQERR